MRSQRPARAREWIAATTVDSSDAIGVPLTLASNTSTAFWVISPDEMTAIFDEPTLVRSIINWEITASTASTTVRQHLQIGLIKWNAEGTGGVDPIPAATVAIVPLPFEDGDAQWIWQYQVNMVGTTLQSFGFRPGKPGEPDDIKTKRKFQNGDGLLFVAANTRNGVNAVDVYVTFNARFLFING